MRVTGRFFTAGHSRSHAAWLSSTDAGLRLEVDGETEPRAPKLVRISGKLGQLPRKLVFDDGSVFEAPGDAPVDDLLPVSSRFTGAVARMEESWKIALAAAVATMVLLLGIYRYGVPLAAFAAAGITPDAVVHMVNDGALEAADRTVLSPTTLGEARQAEVRGLFTSLAPPNDATPPMEVVFRNAPAVGANAFALPGGTIIVTDQLIDAAGSDDEIAGVLAHEIGHVEQRHGLQQIYRALGLTAMAMLVSGDTGQLVHDVINQAAVLQTFAYAREFEAAADSRSVAIMLAAHRNPLAFVDLLDRIAGSEQTGDPGMLSTHPGNRERRTAVEKQVQELCPQCLKRNQDSP